MTKNTNTLRLVSGRMLRKIIATLTQGRGPEWMLYVNAEIKGVKTSQLDPVLWDLYGPPDHRPGYTCR